MSLVPVFWRKATFYIRQQQCARPATTRKYGTLTQSGTKKLSMLCVGPSWACVEWRKFKRWPKQHLKGESTLFHQCHSSAKKNFWKPLLEQKMSSSSGGPPRPCTWPYLSSRPIFPSCLLHSSCPKPLPGISFALFPPGISPPTCQCYQVKFHLLQEAFPTLMSTSHQHSELPQSDTATPAPTFAPQASG